METKNTIAFPENRNFDEYKNVTEENVREVFDMQGWDDSMPESFEVFLENMDHGIEHTYNVYTKALDIADTIEERTWEEIDRDMLYIMAIMHDSWRFHLSDNETKQNKCESKHNKCGVAQIRLFQKRLKNKWVDLSEEKVSSIMDYIYNHDFLNDRLDWASLKEPDSLEWQIVRLADRISTDVIPEVRRYWETWKRKNTPLIKDNITLDDRVNFSFDKIWEYIKSWKLDQMFFFFWLLSVSSEDFSNPVLAELYNDWAVEKYKAVDEILKIAEEEWYNTDEVKKVIDDYLESFWIHL